MLTHAEPLGYVLYRVGHFVRSLSVCEAALNRASEKGGPLHFRVEKIAGLAENPHKERMKNRCTLHK